MKKIIFTILLSSVFNTAFAFPDKPIRLIVPFAPGGPTDVVARTFAETVSQTLGQPIIVENKPGAGGGLGTSLLTKAQADGYTLGIASVSTHIVNPSCNKNVDYDPVKGFTHLALIADMPMVWVKQPNSIPGGFKETWQEIKNRPGHYTQGTPGVCSFGHMFLERINEDMGLEIRHIPYKGSAPAIADFLGKNLDFMFDVESLTIPQIKNGKAVPFAVAWSSRIESLPNTPTLSELGYPSLTFTPWYGVIAPANLPDDVKNKLVSAINIAMKDKRLQTRFKNAGMFPVENFAGEKFAKKIETELNEAKDFLKRRNISELIQ